MPGEITHELTSFKFVILFTENYRLNKCWNETDSVYIIFSSLYLYSKINFFLEITIFGREIQSTRDKTFFQFIKVYLYVK